MRFKYRYILCRLIYANNKVDQSLTTGIIYRTIQSHVEKAYGDYGAAVALANLNIKYFNALTGLMIIRASRAYYPIIIESLAEINTMKEALCELVVMHLAGTIKKCQKQAIIQSRDVVRLISQAKYAQGGGNSQSSLVLLNNGIVLDNEGLAETLVTIEKDLIQLDET